MRNKNFRRAAVAVAIAAVLAGGIWGAIVAADAKYTKLKVLARAITVVKDAYVEEVSYSDLVEAAIGGMLEHLDPHSAYFNADKFKEFRSAISGNFGGLGLEVGARENEITVIAPIEDTPAATSGIKSGDIIMKIDGVVAHDMSLTEAVERMRGEPGTTCILTVMRDGWTEPRDFKIKRAVIQTKSVRGDMIEAGYGRLRLSQFQEESDREFDKELKKLEKNNLKGLLIDLRGNPGGTLNSAIEIADEFLESGLIVYTKGRIAGQEYKAYAKPNDVKREYPIVILIDGGSASASEVLAGALRDHGRAVVVGEPSFGKGSVQTIIELEEDGSALKLTTALYFTPSGHSIQGLGIIPDVLVTSKETLPGDGMGGLNGFKESDLRGSIANPEVSDRSEKAPSKPGELTPGERNLVDVQLQRGLQVLKSYNVFRGPKPQLANP